MVFLKQVKYTEIYRKICYYRERDQFRRSIPTFNSIYI